MANSRPTQWLHSGVLGTWEGSGFSGTVWGSLPPFTVISEMHAGQTVLLTRLQGYMTFGVQQVSSMSNPISKSSLTDVTVNFGIYAKPNLPLASDPPAVPPSASDGFWIRQELMVPQCIEHWDNGTGALSQQITFRFEGGNDNIQGKRGPWTVDPGGLFLVWNFFSGYEFWLESGTQYTGFGGGSVFVSVLVEDA